MTEINNYHFYINSSNRTSGTSNDFSYMLKRPIILTNSSHHLEIKIKACSIPYSFTQVLSPYNILLCDVNIGGVYINETTIAGGTDYLNNPLTITPANYNITTLLAEVSTQLLTFLNLGSTSVLNTVFTYNLNTLKIQMSLTGSYAYTIFVKFKTSSVDMSKMLGITSEKWFGKTTVIPVYVNGDQPVNLYPISNLFIRSTSLLQTTAYENMFSQNDVSNILVQVPIRTQSNTYITYTNELDIRSRLTNSVVDNINLSISDNRAYSITLNNLDWNVMISIYEIRPNRLDFNQAYNFIKDINLNTEDIPNTNTEINSNESVLSIDEKNIKNIQESLKNNKINSNENNLNEEIKNNSNDEIKNNSNEN